ncbi:flavo protein [Cylindrobasidium torrendii FP15055 ss-10]|uniref:Flavo protein n=1 Tax=Cylindrobasidium torrendii FP15055 ss-10 TaxID=1314674 RepID=A0A0D7B7Q7_9AGAR|nr:flavo protein [Cylindrobasidium torrendii FP15055 ss-10]
MADDESEVSDWGLPGAGPCLMPFTFHLRALPRLRNPLSRPILFQRARMVQTKSIAVLDDAELKDGEMKEVDFDDGKVLLTRLGSTINATSAFCTHYGAPLAKGVLTASGTITCPWHGACFNACTGDIEDAPAPAGLHVFKAHVANGKIHVTVNPDYTKKENMARHPKLSTTGFDAVGKGTIVIGGGAGAFGLMESLRENGYKYPITILTQEPHTPIDRTKLSKALITDPTKVQWKTAAEMKIHYGTNIRTNVTVTAVDFQNKKVTVDDKEHLIYDRLVIATGGSARRLPIEGADLENVYTFRTVEDAKKVDAAAQKDKKLVVIGSSFISMEVVAAVAKRELASIDVIGMDEVPFQTVLGKEVGAGLMKYHESTGVKFHMQAKVEKIVASEDGKTATGVVVNGETIPADFVVMGVGVAPNTDLLKDLVKLEPDGGVKVDEYFRIVNVEAGTKFVFAIGDIAHVPLPMIGKQHARIEHWNVAANHGRTLGRTIAKEATTFNKIPVFWSAQGQQLRYCGYAVGHDEVIVKGDPGELKFIAYYAKGGKIVAVCSMQNDPVVSKAARLFQLGKMPTPEAVRDGANLLDIDISSQA